MGRQPRIRWPWRRRGAQFDALVLEMSASFAKTPAVRLNAAIDGALERIAWTLDLDHAAIVDCGNPDGRLVFTHLWSAKDGTLPTLRLPSGEANAIAECLRRGEAVQRSRDASVTVVPLTMDTGARAGLWLGARRRRRWSHADIRRLGGVATALSVALRLRAALAERHSSGALSAHVARVATIGGLAASLAHELNQPLTAIRSNAQTAQHYLSALPRRTEDMHSILLDIVADVTRAGEIIDRMRSLLRNGPPTVGAVDLNDVVRAVTRLLASIALIRRVRITPVLEPGLKPIQADRVQIQQVVLNLLLNAIEAMDRGNRSERLVTITTKATQPAQAVLTVRDTGPGLGPTPDRWFEPFHSTKEGGLGVGLSITRMIVEAHGGSVRGENNDTGGATFYVRLPTDEGTQL